MLPFLNKAIAPLGFKLAKDRSDIPADIARDETFLALYDRCKPYTMTSVERMYSLYLSLCHLIDSGLEGDFVECGVWKGGSSMMIASVLKHRDVADRSIYLYDTFEGMSEPTEVDKAVGGQAASALLEAQEKEDTTSVWCYSSLDEVKSNMAQTGYPADKLVFVKGKIEDTLASNLPGRLALLRLDTDWYESTKIELQLLYPLLNPGGVLIIDDFGHWEGAKKAVLEYFGQMEKPPFLHRIDYTGRLLVKS